MPKPNKKEVENNDKSGFISRCMSSEEAKRDFPDNKQRLAACNSFWDEKSKASYKNLKKLELEKE